jgi:hypothetical protein
MTFFVGHAGAIRLQRGGQNVINASVVPDDVNILLNRFSFDGSENDLITGDLIEIETSDPRGIVFVSGATENYRAYANVNAVGGIRLFPNFIDAVNNERANEIELVAFPGDPILIDVGIKDTRHNTLGSVTSFEINTDRAAIETTSLSDSFRQQYSAGLINGNGSIECLFSYETLAPEETPLFLLQVINRLRVGSAFNALLSISSTERAPAFIEEVFYDIEAVVTRTGVTVTSDAIVSCSIDFVTTGDFRLRIGTPSEYILKEDDDAIYIEQSLDYLLQEATD